MDVSGHDLELFTLFEELIQLALVANTGPGSGVQEDRRAPACPQLIESVPGEILVGQIVDSLFHPLNILLEPALHRLQPRSSNSWQSPESTDAVVGNSSTVPCPQRTCFIVSTRYNYLLGKSVFFWL